MLNQIETKISQQNVFYSICSAIGITISTNNKLTKVVHQNVQVTKARVLGWPST